MILFFELSLFVIWLYLLSVLRRARLASWLFMTGFLGLFFFICLFFLQPLEDLVTRIIGLLTSIPGNMSGMYQIDVLAGLIHLRKGTELISVSYFESHITVILILLMLSMLVFYKGYTWEKRVILGAFGTAYLIFVGFLYLVTYIFIIYLAGNTIWQALLMFGLRMLLYMASCPIFYFYFMKGQLIDAWLKFAWNGDRL